MAITYLQGGRVLDQFFGAVSPTIASTYYIALSTTTPTNSGTNFTEPSTSGTAYARVAVLNDKSHWGNAASSSLTNSTTITFPISTASWGTVTYVGIYATATVGAGSLLYYSLLGVSRVIAIGTTFYLNPGDITVSLTN